MSDAGKKKTKSRWASNEVGDKRLKYGALAHETHLVEEKAVLRQRAQKNIMRSTNGIEIVGARKRFHKLAILNLEHVDLQ